VEESKRLLELHLAKGRLVICEIVYAELASQFLSAQDLNRFLAETGIRLVNSNEKALYIAGEKWVEYSKKKSPMQCFHCGRHLKLSCPHCASVILTRQRVLSDFIIGAHALVHADILLSRDRGVYKTYFNELKIAG
jgi:predicted nucleic acid-binding protein